MSQSFVQWVRSKQFYNSTEWERLRMQALERAEYHCETPYCREPVPPGDVHHIQSRYHFPLLALRLDNTRVLCCTCHAREHGWTRRGRVPKWFRRMEAANDAQLELPFGDSISRPPYAGSS